MTAIFFVKMTFSTCTSLANLTITSPFFDKDVLKSLLNTNNEHWAVSWYAAGPYNTPLIHKNVHFPKQVPYVFYSWNSEYLQVVLIDMTKSMSLGAPEAAASYGRKKFSMPDPCCKCDQLLWLKIVAKLFLHLRIFVLPIGFL